MNSPPDALSLARSYAELGLAVFFCIGKMPAPGTHGYLDATTDPRALEELSERSGPRATNVAISPGKSSPELLVVDLDSHKPAHKRPAHLRFLAVCDRNGGLPATTRVRTPSGGSHLYFRLPPAEPEGDGWDLGSQNGVRNPSTDRIESGVDFRHTSGHTILPGSVDPVTKKAYTFDGHDFGTLAEAPLWLLEFLRPARPNRPAQFEPFSYDPPTSGPERDRTHARISGIVDAACVKLSELGPGQSRRRELMTAAYRLGGLLHLGYPESELFRKLVQASENCGHQSRDTLRAIKAGIEAGKGAPYALMPERAMRLQTSPDPTDTLTNLRYWAAKYRPDNEDQLADLYDFDDAGPDPLVYDDLDFKPAKNGPGAPVSDMANVVTILEGDRRWQGRITFDQFASCIQINGEAIADHLVHEVRLWMKARYRFLPSERAMIEALQLVSKRHLTDPLADELRSFRWDGVPRLGRFMRECFGVGEGPMVEETEGPSDGVDLPSVLGTKFMISAVARALDPGCQVDNVLVLHGPQGLYKSNGVRALFGEHLFASTAFDVRNKDARVALQGRWGIEWPELDSIKRSEATAVKAFITDRVDDYRPPYGKANVKHPRRCVFIGTTNDGKFLSDATGDRRYWVLSCLRKVEIPKIGQWRDQLIAEAVARYDAGEQWWLTTEEEAARSHAADQFRYVDPWVETVARWVHENRKGSTAFTAEEVLMDRGEPNPSGKGWRRHPGIGLSPGTATQFHLERLGRVLTSLGYKQKRATISGRRVRVWKLADPIASELA